MAKNRFNIPLRFVVYREGVWWIAHNLEMDVVAEGDSPSGALRSAIELASLQISTAVDEGDVESVFRPAPPEIWRMFAVADDMPITPAARGKTAKYVDKLEARELVLN